MRVKLLRVHYHKVHYVILMEVKIYNKQRMILILDIVHAIEITHSLKMIQRLLNKSSTVHTMLERNWIKNSKTLSY